MPPEPATIPDLDRRLQARRAEVADTLGKLKRRVGRDVRNLSPRRQLKRRPEAALALAGVAGWVAGRIAARLLRVVGSWLA
ncbi:MAG: hypothetical protein ACRD2D_00535 [Terriglobales bacterium]